jgi:alkylation response protein AidB-like acyl-CoA dehydrogenase
MGLAVDAGWAAPSWPDEWFGRSLTLAQSQAVIDEFACAGAPGAGHDIANLPSNVIFHHGSDDVRARRLRDMLTGATSFCLLYSEPGAGSDLAGVQTRAERDGDEWVVNGQKVWTSAAQSADFGLLLARTDWDVPKHQGLTYFLFPMRQSGVEIRPIKMITGLSHFNEVFLTDARTPHADVLGEVNGGWSVMQTALVYERILMGGGAPAMFPVESSMSTQESALLAPDVDLVAMARARDRAHDPTVRQALTRLHILKAVNEWNGMRAREEMKRGLASPAASLGKLAMSEILHFGGRVHAALLGAEATLAAPDSDAARLTQLAMLNAYVNSIGGGTDQVQRNILGERVLGLPKEPDPYKQVAFRDLPKSPATSR